ncbi:MAG: hypothetical protein INR71_01130, partial [Terriglobus roseus]|nr:hypothetical protein [Terriglobus roseus]
SLGRLARSTWQTSTAVIETGQTAASRAVAVTGGHRPISGHQRRHSSSKTPSQPPAGDGVKVVGGRAQQRAQQGDEEGEAGTREYESPLRAIGRRRRRQHEASLPTPSESFSNLPSVPPTSHLDARGEFLWDDV